MVRSRLAKNQTHEPHGLKSIRRLVRPSFSFFVGPWQTPLSCYGPKKKIPALPGDPESALWRRPRVGSVGKIELESPTVDARSRARDRPDRPKPVVPDTLGVEVLAIRQPRTRHAFKIRGNPSATAPRGRPVRNHAPRPTCARGPDPQAKVARPAWKPSSSTAGNSADLASAGLWTDDGSPLRTPVP